MKHQVWISITCLFLCSFVVAGCDANQSNTTEDNDVTKDKTNDEQVTLTPEEKETLYVEYLHERLHELPEEPTEVKVSLAKWMSQEELQELLNSPSAPDVSVLYVRIQKDNTVYDSLDIDGTNSLSNLESILNQKAEEIASAVPASFSDTFRVTQDDLKSGVVVVSGFAGKGTPAKLEKWWTNNNGVRFVQTITTSFDNMKKAYSPEEEVR